MLSHKIVNVLVLIFLVASPLFAGGSQALSQVSQAASGQQGPKGPYPNDEIGGTNSGTGQMRTTTQAMREAAAYQNKQAQRKTSLNFAGVDNNNGLVSPLSAESAAPLAVMAAPLSPPDYFGVANWAISPLPALDAAGQVVAGSGMRKFVDKLPGLCGIPTANGNGTNGLGQCLPVAVPDTSTFPGTDYYEIGLVQYTVKMSSDLPPTLVRGYVQISTTNVPGAHVQLFNAPSPNGAGGGAVLYHGQPVYGVTAPQYLGPVIVASGCDLAAKNTCTPRAVRVKFTNFLPIGSGGDLQIPTDTYYMGAGMGPNQSISAINLTNSGGTGYKTAPTVAISAPPPGGTQALAVANINNGAVVSFTIQNGGDGYTSTPTVTLSGGGFTTPATAAAVLTSANAMEMYTQNRATLHLHGGNTPWISDGTPHQWTVPAGEITSYSKGDSVGYVPDMCFDNNTGAVVPGAQASCPAGSKNDPGPGSLTFYWTNEQSGRLMFFHDHSYGITRLNVYAGEAAGYLIVDQAQESALKGLGIPGTLVTGQEDFAHVIPLVIQDKTFVPDSGTAGGQLASEDPTWSVAQYGGKGALWFPHVYMPNQNPADVTGANAFGRWDYGPWFWPPQNPATFLPVGQPYACSSVFYNGTPGPAFPPLMCPGTLNPSGVPEGFMDTPVVNGTAYPTLTVDPSAYRFQILSAGNDRTLNLGLYVAEPLTIAVTNGGSGYTAPPTINITGGGGSGATATAILSSGAITSILVTGVGHGYTTAPNVTISGDGTGAAATAVVALATTTISAINMTNIGTGYTFATVTIDPPAGCTTGCQTATAIANITPAGSVMGVNVTNPGTGYTSNPSVAFSAPTAGVTATGIASINSEVKMVPAVPPTTTSALKLCSQTNPTGGAMLVTALLDGTGNPLNGTGLPANCWPSAWPTDGRDGGVPDPTRAGPPIIQLATEGGLLPAPVAIPSTPVGYEYNRRSITVLNIFTHGLLIGPAERADIVIDFSKYAGQTLIFYNDSPAPVPAFDPRNDYYTGAPDQTSSGGAPTILPGYGPNTRTIMQIKVNAGVGGGAALAGVNVTNGGAGYTAPAVTIANPPAGGTLATATALGSVTGLSLTAAGSGYVNPQVNFVVAPGNTGSGATAVMSSGVVNSLLITNPGAGYSSAPTVGFTGTGTLAAAKATVSVSGITPSTPGANYSSAPSVAINDIGVPSTATTLATAKATVSVAGLSLGGGGAGYSAAPTVTISDAGTTATTLATGSATISVTGFANLVGGAGYTSAPTVLIPDIATLPTASPLATAKATISVTGFKNIVPSSGVACTAPSVTVIDNGGTPTTAAVVTPVLDVSGNLVNLTITTPGAGYTTPAVQFSDATCTGFSATATGLVDNVIVTAGAKYTTPQLQFTGGGFATAATATATGAVDGLTLLTPGVHYTTPQVAFGGAATTPATASTVGVLDSLSLVVPGVHYTTPQVVFSGGGAGATQATAAVTGVVDSLTLTSGGTGYSAAPTVTFTGGGTPTTPATALATIASTGILLTNGGSGYNVAPTVQITDTAVPGGSGATAVATLSITAVSLTNPGAGYTSIPAVTIADTGTGTGTGAAAAATLAAGTSFNLAPVKAGLAAIFAVTQDPVIIPEPAYPANNGNGPATYSRIQDNSLAAWIGGPIGLITLVNGGGGYTAAPTIGFTGGGGTGAAATATLAPTFVATLTLGSGGSGYTSAPTVGFTGGGGGTGAAATAKLAPSSVASVTITNQGNGYTTPPTVTFSLPQIVTGTRAAGTAVLGGSNGRRVVGVTITQAGSGYTAAPTVSFTGGGGSGAAATSRLAPAPVGSVTLTAGGSGYTAAPTVSFTGGGGSGATATATINPVPVASITVTSGGTGYTGAPSISFTGGGGSGASATVAAPVTQFHPKAIQELFTLDFGKMNATLGVELPFTNFLTQTTIPYGYIDPPTEIFSDGETQIWKITHNGVDTHFIHFHLFTVQVINRVGWDGMIKPPDDNELAFKDTVRMNPLEDIIVALRPMKQKLPWQLPLSERALDVTEPIGSSHLNQFTNVGVDNNPATVNNDVINFGYEYVWHCHILGHEENDMMRAMVFVVPPAAPSNLAVTQSTTTRAVKLTWTDNSLNESGFTIYSSIQPPTNPAWIVAGTAPAMPGTGGTASFYDLSVNQRTNYWYKVVANNLAGYTQTYAVGVAGYPSLDAPSGPSNVVTVFTNNVGGTPVPFVAGPYAPYVFASAFQAGADGWSGVVGGVQGSKAAEMSRTGGMMGMAADLSNPQGSFVFDNSPAGTAVYDAAFEFNPNGAVSGLDPVDIFVGLDQFGEQAFGIQYQKTLVESEAVYQVRSWVQQNGDQVFSNWVTIENLPNRLELAWASGANAGFSLYIDSFLAQTLTGDTSGRQLASVLLGPSGGLSGASGTMYFDEFTSSTANGVGHSIYIPNVRVP